MKGDNVESNDNENQFRGKTIKTVRLREKSCKYFLDFGFAVNFWLHQKCLTAASEH